ncbi:MAG: lytic transglycosylase domain-containing protein [bacterium]|nr:lytic transglycosylase domain-containing protein [bacterium]
MGRYKGRTSASRYTDDEIADLVTRYSKKYGLRESLVYAVIKVESNFSREATSKKGASGLMQLMPGTARDMGVTDINDPAQNIAGGTQYLSKLLKLFDGNEKLALAGYNAGPGTVKKYKGIPPYKETQNYVRSVQSWDRKYASGAAKPGGSGSKRSSTKIASVKSPGKKTASTKTVIHFHSGLSQEVDGVVLKDDHYHVQIRNRTFPIHKRSVKKIEEPA